MVSELICLCLSGILLLSAVRAYHSCLRVQERILRLDESWQAAQLAAVGEETPEPWRAVCETSERQGVWLTEVQVYEGAEEKPLCTLLQAAP